MNAGQQHDLFSYSPIIARKPVRWPGNARLALWVVPNIEHQVLERPGVSIDVPWHSRTEYGNRVGVWRLMEVLDRLEITATVALNSAVCRHYPAVVEACVARHWELMGHGITNSQSLVEQPPEQEREIIREALAEIRQATGQPVTGWLSPGLRSSAQTPALLLESGVEYLCDWVNDDLPYRFNNGLWSIPYSNDLNDMRLIRPPVFGADDWALLVKRAFDRLYEEGRDMPRVMCLALHPFVTGTAGRIGLLDEVLTYIVSHDDVWTATGSEIIASYAAQAHPS